jgi:hypothetical protein
MKQTHFSSKSFCHTSSPCAGVETFRPQRLWYVVDVDDLATFGIDAEDVYSLTEFLSLKYNSMKNLKKQLACLSFGALQVPSHCLRRR